MAKKKAEIPLVILEWREQAKVFEWAWTEGIKKWPELRWLNGSANGVRLTIGQAVKAKRCGLVRGWPDICLPVNNGKYVGLYIELKQIDKAVSSKEQKECGEFLVSQGYLWCVAHGHDAAIKIIIKYLGEMANNRPEKEAVFTFSKKDDIIIYAH